MVARMPALAYEDELEWEEEGELEGEAESEEFFRTLVSAAQRGRQPAALRRVGAVAARSALGGLRAVDRAGGVRSLLGGAPVGAFEAEWETEGEWEEELTPRRGVNPDALMEHLGHAAASAEGEAEAEAFMGALIPLAARLAPRAAPLVMRAAPGLIRGVAQVTRTLRRDPAMRPLVRAVPTIVRRTVADIDQQARAGRAVSPQQAVRILSGQTNRVLSNPALAAQAWQRARTLDHRYHRAVRPRPIAGR